GGRRQPAEGLCNRLEEGADAPALVAEETAPPTLAVVRPARRAVEPGLAEVGVGHGVVTSDGGAVDAEGAHAVGPGRRRGRQRAFAVEDDGQIDVGAPLANPES